MNSRSTSITIKVGSLNARSLIKQNNSNTTKLYARYLRSLQLDILTLQETHATFPDIQASLDIHFQAKSTCWTKHCGVVILNPMIEMEPILITIDQRMILCRISHSSQKFSPFYLITIYAPSVQLERQTFFQQLLSLPFFTNPWTTPENSSVVGDILDDSRVLLTGDFNYHPDFTSQSPRLAPQRQWIELLQTYFHNCVHPESPTVAPTFRRGRAMTTIDYMYASPRLHTTLTASGVEFLNNEWTDHALLTCSFTSTSDKHGPGIWRANPALTKNYHFLDALHTALTELISSMSTDPPSMQQQWDMIKRKVKLIAQRYGRRQSQWRKLQLDKLQQKRDNLIHQHKDNPATLHSRLPIVERQIGALQQEIADNLALRAGKHWREHGEISPGFLKRTITSRLSSRHISTLQHPVTTEISSSPSHMREAAQAFYQHLYSKEEVNSNCIQQLIDHLPPSCRLTDEEQRTLLTPIDINELRQSATRTPKSSSPGIDGIPYEILSEVLTHPLAAPIALNVYNDALIHSIFPESWLETCMSLLPKKGDLSMLKNYRPISLINTDAKVFTRLLNARLMPTMNRLISPHQLGFMPGRFIGENGKILQVAMSMAEATSDPSVGLLLDQEKAYDRIHPDYLHRVMSALQIPASFISTICALFFNTRIRVNVNGYLTDPVRQERGLRQGDPLSPLLFNIAFDPFIRAVQRDTGIRGYMWPNLRHSDPVDPSRNLPALKILAYADDTLVVLHSTTEFASLQRLISTYCQASNASLNFAKTQAFSLSGAPQPTWRSFLESCVPPISAWHDKQSPEPLVYLGYPVYSSLRQRDSFVQLQTNKLRQLCDLHSQRQLSVRGRATVLNSLIYSTLWHTLRMISLTKAQLQTLRGIGSRFMNGHRFPRISADSLSFPRSKGGVGSLDPLVQYLQLQWRWLQPILDHPSAMVSHITSLPYLQYGLQYLSNHQDPRWPILFPSRRNGFRGLIHNPYAGLFQAADVLTHDFTTATPNVATILSLDLQTVTMTPTTSTDPNPSLDTLPFSTLFTHKPGMRRLRVSSIFLFDPDLKVIRFRRPAEIEESPRLWRTYLQAAIAGQFTLSPLLLRSMIAVVDQPPLSDSDRADLRPLATCLLQSARPLERNGYRRTVHAKTCCPPSFLTSIPSALWNLFWRSSVNPIARTVWFRLVHQRIPCLTILNRLIPSKYPSALCKHCSSAPDCPMHFFFLCPLKTPIWQSVLSRFRPSFYSHIDQLAKAVCSLQVLTDLATQDGYPISIGSIIGCILQGIWVAHWAHVFSNAPFSTTQVVQQCCTLILRLQAENTYKDD